MPIRVLICDDEEAMRLTLRRWLSHQKDIEIVGEAGDGKDAVSLAEKVVADVILMDVIMPELDGVEATRKIRRKGIKIPILVFSADQRAADRIQGLSDVQFMSKAEMGPRELTDAIRAAAKGN